MYRTTHGAAISQLQTQFIILFYFIRNHYLKVYRRTVGPLARWPFGEPYPVSTISPVHTMLMVYALRVYSCVPLIILIPFNSERAHLTFGAIYYESPPSAASSSFNFFLFTIVSI